jgi:ABC-type phosphate transport system substrate-binding protein
MGRCRGTVIAGALGLLVPLALGAVDPAQGESAAAPPYVVIVHPDNDIDSIERKWLAEAFFKRKTRWSSKLAIQPVDAKPSATARERFSKDVLKRSVSAVKSYWAQRIFSGRDAAPPELANDEAIVTYVLEHPGGIGYVSGGADLKGAKVVQVK